MIGLAIAWLPLTWAALLVAGTIFLIMVLHRPLLSVYTLIPIIPFSTLLAISAGGFKVGLMEIVLVLGVVAWLLKYAFEPVPNWAKLRSTQPTLFSAPLVGPFLLFLAGLFLSWLTTFSIGGSMIETAKWLEMLGLYLLIVNLLPAKHLGWVVFTLLLAGLAQAALGLYQFVFKVGPEGFLLFEGRFLRAYGTFEQPNPYAGYLGLVLPLALSLTLWAVTNSSRKVKHSKFLNLGSYLLPICYISCLGLLLAALFASQSRAAWLGFTVAAVITLAGWSKKIAWGLAALAFAVVLLGLAGTFEWGLFNTNEITRRFGEAFAVITITDVGAIEVNDANFATIERLAHWQAAQAMWRDHLWLGVGFGNYAAIYPAYAVGRWLDPLGHAHNYLLNIGAEVGLVGIVVYLIFWIWTFRVLWLALQSSYGFERAVVAGGIGILVHLHVHNLFDNLYVQGMYLHIAVILALISVIYQCHQSNLRKGS
jgi:O-antigen ligase